LKLGNDPKTMREKPGQVMGYLSEPKKIDRLLAERSPPVGGRSPQGATRQRPPIIAVMGRCLSHFLRQVSLTFQVRSISYRAPP
jgi:hypothetical protein